MSRYKLIPIKERNPLCRCWFCKTEKSVKYQGKIVNPRFFESIKTSNPQPYMGIYICNKCVINHKYDLIELEDSNNETKICILT